MDWRGRGRDRLHDRPHTGVELAARRLAQACLDRRSHLARSGPEARSAGNPGGARGQARRLPDLAVLRGLRAGLQRHRLRLPLCHPAPEAGGRSVEPGRDPDRAEGRVPVRLKSKAANTFRNNDLANMSRHIHPVFTRLCGSCGALDRRRRSRRCAFDLQTPRIDLQTDLRSRLHSRSLKPHRRQRIRGFSPILRPPCRAPPFL